MGITDHKRIFPTDAELLMGIPHWLVPLTAFLLLVDFVGFAFRQGMKVKSDDRENRLPSVGAPIDPTNPML